MIAPTRHGRGALAATSSFGIGDRDRPRTDRRGTDGRNAPPAHVARLIRGRSRCESGGTRSSTTDVSIARIMDSGHESLQQPRMAMLVHPSGRRCEPGNRAFAPFHSVFCANVQALAVCEMKL